MSRVVLVFVLLFIFSVCAVFFSLLCFVSFIFSATLFVLFFDVLSLLCFVVVIFVITCNNWQLVLLFCVAPLSPAAVYLRQYIFLNNMCYCLLLFFANCWCMIGIMLPFWSHFFLFAFLYFNIFVTASCWNITFLYILFCWVNICCLICSYCIVDHLYVLCRMRFVVEAMSYNITIFFFVLSPPT